MDDVFLDLAEFILCLCVAETECDGSVGLTVYGRHAPRVALDGVTPRQCRTAAAGQALQRGTRGEQQQRGQDQSGIEQTGPPAMHDPRPAPARPPAGAANVPADAA